MSSRRLLGAVESGCAVLLPVHLGGIAVSSCVLTVHPSGEPVNGRVEAISGGLLATLRALSRITEKFRAVSGGPVPLASCVEPVDRGSRSIGGRGWVHVFRPDGAGGRRLVAGLRGSVPRLGFQIPLVSPRDDLPQTLLAVISNPVAHPCGAVTVGCEVISLVGLSVPLLGLQVPLPGLTVLVGTR